MKKKTVRKVEFEPVRKKKTTEIKESTGKDVEKEYESESEEGEWESEEEEED